MVFRFQANHLQSTNANKVEDFVEKVLDRLMFQELTSQLNWSGAMKKEAFEKTRIAQAIISKSRCIFCVENRFSGNLL